MSPRAFFMTVLLATVLSAGTPLCAQERPATPNQPTPTAEAPSVVVLDTYGVWRFHSTLEPPVRDSGEAVAFKYRWMNYKTPGPAAGWAAPDFDDRTWNRGPTTTAPKSVLVSAIHLRGKFTVTGPASVQGLKLSVGYHGGLVVYLNGKEVKREHIQQGKTLAEGPGGEDRRLADLALGPELLRKGVNVIGLEIMRAPYPAEGGETGENVFSLNTCEIMQTQLTAASDKGLIPNAKRPEGFQVWNADVLASDFNLDFGDQAEPLRPVTIVGARNGMFTGKVMLGSTKPIRGLKVTPGDLKGNGGLIPASSVNLRYGVPWGEQALADETRLRDASPYPTWPTMLGGLAEKPLAEYPVPTVQTYDTKKKGIFYAIAPLSKQMYSPGNKFLYRGGKANIYYDYLTLPGELKPVPGAVASVWIRVKVPASAKAGAYSGSVRVEAEGEKPVDVPVELRVSDWTVPDTQDYRTWVDIIECPDTLALHYDVPMWSDKHFEMIGRSIKAMGETGCRILYIPLIGHTNLGNEESMVRWIKKGDKFEYDFSVMERYLDVAEKNMGKPKVIVLVVWDLYMMPSDTVADPEELRKEKWDPHKWRQSTMAEQVKKGNAEYGKGPLVTELDPATGKTENVYLPPHFDAEASRPLWKPLFDQLRTRLAKRGLQDTMMLGCQGDAWASKPEHEFFKEITGGIPWIVQSHEGFDDNKLMYGVSKIGYQARVWSLTFSDDNADRGPGYRGGIESHHGWARKDLVAQYDRFSRERHPATRWLQLPEVCITGSQRGPGRMGGEYWPVVKNAKGEPVGRTCERYPETNWKLLVIPESVLGAGPDGPVATNRLEALREGVQEAEARTAIESALVDEAAKAKLGPDLVKRCEAYLYDRHMMMWLSLSDLQFYGRKPNEPGCYAQGWRAQPGVSGHNWFLSSGWQQRTAELYDLAGEVARKIKGE